MTKSNKRYTLKIIIDVILFAIFVLLLVNYFYGESSTLEVVAICLYLIKVALEFISRARYYKKLRTYEDMLKVLEAVHRIRYELYLEKNENEFQQVSQTFDVGAQTMLDMGQRLLEYEETRRSNRKQIQKIMNRVKELTQTIEPPTA